jgi:hypothetical protein
MSNLLRTRRRPLRGLRHRDGRIITSLVFSLLLCADDWRTGGEALVDAKKGGLVLNSIEVETALLATDR